MTHEKRTRMEPIPKDIDRYLNSKQSDRLIKVRRYGLELAFIRRNELLEPEVFLELRNKAVFALLSDMGTLMFNHDRVIRHVIDEALVLHELDKLSRLTPINLSPNLEHDED